MEMDKQKYNVWFYEYSLPIVFSGFRNNNEVEQWVEIVFKVKPYKITKRML